MSRKSQAELHFPKSRDGSFDEAQRVYKKNKRVVLEFCTGFGKTYAALRLIDQTIASGDSRPWAIIVPRIDLIDTWYKEIDDWKMGHLEKHIKILCYDSLHTLDPELEWSFCFDEIHNLTELRVEKVLDICEEVDDAVMIGCSATIDSKKFTLARQLGFIKAHRVLVTLDEGVEAGVVTDYKIVKLPVVPNEKWFRKLKGLTGWFNQAKKSGKKASIDAAIFARVRHVYNSANKFELAKHIADNLDTSEKTMFFVANIAQATALSEYTGWQDFHSEYTKTQRREILKNFNEAKSGVLISCYTLNEGVNISGISKAVIMQVRSNEREMIQRLGRILRWLGKQDGQKGICYVAFLRKNYFSNTKKKKYPRGDGMEKCPDEAWVDKALKNLDQSKISERIIPMKYYQTDKMILDNE
jgi:superfamily II DNA or RNA helicase